MLEVLFWFFIFAGFILVVPSIITFIAKAIILIGAIILAMYLYRYFNNEKA